MTLKQNKDKTPEEKAQETSWAEERLGFPLESADPIEEEPLEEDTNKK